MFCLYHITFILMLTRQLYDDCLSLRGSLSFETSNFLLCVTVLYFSLAGSTEKCFPGHWSQGIQPRFNCPACHRRAALDIPHWKLCSLHICQENPPSEEKEACFKKEDEEGKAEARCIGSWRIDGGNM